MTGFNDLSFLLAEGWGDLVVFIVVAAFYLFGALAKAWANRAKSEEGQKDSKLRQLVKETKRSILQNQTEGQQSLQSQVYPKGITEKARDRQKRMSEWDRQQALKRSRLQQRQQPVRPAAQQAVPPQPPVKRKPPAISGVIGQIVSSIEAEVKKASDSFYSTIPASVRVPSAKPLDSVSAAEPSLHSQQAPPISKTIRSHASEKTKILRTLYLTKFIRSPENLRNAIILKEILDKPLALRDSWC